MLYDIDFEQNPLISYNDAINWDQVFNKIKPNLTYFDYVNSLNNHVNDLIKLSQVTRTKSRATNIKYKKCTQLK